VKTSVIIPVYNREAFIETALRSLLRQCDDADLDIIVVNDGSTDRTAEIVSTISAREKCVRLIRQPQTGVASARNNGLAHVPHDAELVTFLDSDDISVSGRFAAEVPLFREDPALALTYSLMTLADDIDEEQLRPTAQSHTCTVRGISLTTSIFRKSAIEHLSGFDETLKQAEDMDYLVRFLERHPKYRLLDNVSIIYRKHPGNTTKDTAQAKRDFLKVLLMSAQRRRRDPSIGNIPRFFDTSALNEEQHAPLR
jgi:glycosyltransferase involved in cell wall biosynthesis